MLRLFSIGAGSTGGDDALNLLDFVFIGSLHLHAPLLPGIELSA
jgi:hypothetical protein